MAQKKNLAFSIFEFLIIAASQFAILKIVAGNLGVAQIGTWSILVSSIQMSKVFDPGAVAGSLKYMALASMKKDIKAIENYVAASLFMVIIVYSPVLLFMYFFLGDILLTVVGDPRLADDLYLIPYVCIAFLIQNISLCFVGCINNMGVGYFKSIANIVGMLIQLILSLILVNDYGLLGLTISQLVNYSLVVIVALIVMFTYLKLNVFRFFRFDVKTIKKIFKVGAAVQITSITWTMYEFSSRMLMARLGGLDFSGYYEVAYRFAAQARILSSYVLAPITPTFIQRYQDGSDAFKRYYSQIYSYVSFLGLVLVLGTISLAPLLSIIMFEYVHWIFVGLVITSSIGAYFHILAMTSEQCSVSLGLPKYNFYGMLVILLTTYILSFLFGTLWGGGGVAIGILCSIISGVVCTIYCNSTYVIKSSYLPSYSIVIQKALLIVKRKFNENTNVSR